MSTIHLILQYGADVWADAIRVQKYRHGMEVVQRRGELRIASSYRTVSGPAVLVNANVVPIDLLAFELKRTYDRAREIRIQRVIAETLESTLATWQQHWAKETKGRWTHRLIPSISEWAKRDHGEVNFYLIQFLTRHGYLWKYLYNLNRVQKPFCKSWGHDEASSNFLSSNFLFQCILQ